MLLTRIGLRKGLFLFALAVATLIVVWLSFLRPHTEPDAQNTPANARDGKPEEHVAQDLGSLDTIEKQKQYVRERIEAVSGLPDFDRAEALWDLWLTVTSRNWSHEWWHLDQILSELKATGDAGMEVLLRDIEDPSRQGSVDASELLACFHPKATHRLIGLLDSESDEVLWAALRALWHCPLSELTPEEHAKLRTAVQPFLQHPVQGIKERARRIIKDLDYYPPIVPHERGTEAEGISENR